MASGKLRDSLLNTLLCSSSCQRIVQPIILETHGADFCSKCDCRWERRNTTTMKVGLTVLTCDFHILAYCCNVWRCSVHDRVANELFTKRLCLLQVVVIVIICIVSLLFLYMLFLLCLDPLVSRRQRAYREHDNEEVNMVIIISVQDSLYITPLNINLTSGANDLCRVI